MIISEMTNGTHLGSSSKHHSNRSVVHCVCKQRISLCLAHVTKCSDSYPYPPLSFPPLNISANRIQKQLESFFVVHLVHSLIFAMIK